MIWALEKEKLGKELLCSLYDAGMIKTFQRDKPEGWNLVSGLWSPFYIQLRPLCSYPDILIRTGYALGKLIRNEAPHINRLVGVAIAGIPITTAITVSEKIPSAFTRKIEGITSLNDFKMLIENYGEHSLLEGIITNYDNVMLVDDLVTKFESKIIALEQVKYEVEQKALSGITCRDVMVLIDREQGAHSKAKKYGISLYSLIPFKTKGLNWLKEYITNIEYKIIVDYLDNPGKYQDENQRRNILSSL